MASKPRTIRVAHRKWWVIMADHLYADRRWCYGLCDGANRTIYIARWVNGQKQSKAQRAATLDHEIAHAHLYEIGEQFAGAFEAARDASAKASNRKGK